MKHIDEDRLQDVIADLEDDRAAGNDMAGFALDILDAYSSRESTVIGMLMARRPHDEIRDALLAVSSAGPEGGHQ